MSSTPHPAHYPRVHSAAYCKRTLTPARAQSGCGEPSRAERAAWWARTPYLPPCSATASSVLVSPFSYLALRYKCHRECLNPLSARQHCGLRSYDCVLRNLADAAARNAERLLEIMANSPGTCARAASCLQRTSKAAGAHQASPAVALGPGCLLLLPLCVCVQRSSK